MQSVRTLIPAPHKLLEIDGAGHELLTKKNAAEWAARIVDAFQTFVKRSTRAQQQAI
jgi:alpha-beta hydrolase superfamily lysophospholipase